MIFKKKALSYFLLLAALMFALVGCQKESTDGESPTPGDKGKDTDTPAVEQVINVSSNDIATLNTLGSFDQPSSIVMNNIFEGLYRLDPENQPIPGMAESHEVTDDQKTYTFHLRQDAKWSNGTPVTAHDFTYAWKKAMKSDTLSPYSYLMAPIKNANAVQNPSDPLYDQVDEIGVKATDDYTLVVELENPTSYFLSLLTTPAFFPQNQEFVEAQGDQYALSVENLIYNGPFVLENWKQGASYTYKKNADYWDAANVKIETINANIIKETSTAVNMYEAGELDYIGLTAEFVDQYAADPGFSTYLDSTIYFIRMNQRNEYLANANIRKALDLGWNKKDLETILNNGSIAAGYVVPAEFAFDTNGNDFRSKYSTFNPTDLDKAVEYWNKGLEELGVDSITLELLNYDSETNKTIAQYVKNQLEKNLPGLTLNINQQPSKQKLDLEASQDYDLSYSGWAPDYQDAISFVEIFHSGNPYNWMDFANEEVDRLIDNAYTEADAAKRWSDLQEAERIILEELAGVSPMYQTGATTLTKPNVKGIARHPYGAFLSFQWTYVE